MARASKKVRLGSALVGAVFLFTSAGAAFAQGAPQDSAQTQTQQAPEKHHSKMKGAVLGGAGGAVVGGKKGAMVGAGAGAMIQHHKNKKAEKKAAKAAGQ